MINDKDGLKNYPNCEKCKAETLDSKYMSGLWDMASFSVKCLSCGHIKTVDIDDYFYDHKLEYEIHIEDDSYYGQESL